MIIMLAATAYFAFRIGQRYDRGRYEVEDSRQEVAREERGRRGAMKLRPIKIHR